MYYCILSLCPSFNLQLTKVIMIGFITCPSTTTSMNSSTLSSLVNNLFPVCLKRFLFAYMYPSWQWRWELVLPLSLNRMLYFCPCRSTSEVLLQRIMTPSLTSAWHKHPQRLFRSLSSTSNCQTFKTSYWSNEKLEVYLRNTYVQTMDTNFYNH